MAGEDDDALGGGNTLADMFRQEDELSKGTAKLLRQYRDRTLDLEGDNRLLIADNESLRMQNEGLEKELAELRVKILAVIEENC